MSSTEKNKKVSEKDKEVLENIMEELEQEAADKAKEAEEKAEGAEAEAKEEASSEVETENVEAPETEASQEGESEESPKKKGIFGKKDKKDPLKEKVEELNDKVMRQMAEFENFRKRTEKEKAQMFEQGQSNVLLKLLPVIDNFERGLAAVPEDEKDGAFADGMNKIYKQLMNEVEDLGAEEPQQNGPYQGVQQIVLRQGRALFAEAKHSQQGTYGPHHGAQPVHGQGDIADMNKWMHEEFGLPPVFLHLIILAPPCKVC